MGVFLEAKIRVFSEFQRVKS